MTNNENSISFGKLNPAYWTGRFEQWLKEQDEQTKEAFQSEFFGGIQSTIADWGVAFGKWFVSITPDLVGYTAIACGALMMLSAMAGRSMLKPIGLFSAVGIVGMCIVGTV